MKSLHIRNQLHHHDHDFIDGISPLVHWIERYFKYEAHGFDRIPAGKKCVVVMNHGIIPFHGFLLTKKLIELRGIYPRGLGAGFLFSIPGLREFFLKGGVVNANEYNARQLLKENNCLMLAPGGIYEGLVAHPGMKRIPWERRKGFVELAIETNTPIIPSFCGGINDVYFNSKFLLKWRIKILETTRFSLPLFCGIGLLPLPAKLIHNVGEPIPITKKNGEKPKAQVKRIHAQVIQAMHQLAEKQALLREPTWLDHLRDRVNEKLSVFGMLDE